MEFVYKASGRIYKQSASTDDPEDNQTEGLTPEMHKLIQTAVVDAVNESLTDDFHPKDARRTLRFLEDLVGTMQHARMINSAAKYTAHMAHSASLLEG